MQKTIKAVSAFLKKNLLIKKFQTHEYSDLFAVDFEVDMIKLLKLSYVEDSLQVDNYSSIPVPAGVITREELKDINQTSSLLRDLYRQSNIKTKNVAIAIPRSIAIIKNTIVDKRLNEDDLESRAWIEANRFFPDLVGDIYLDYEITGASLPDENQVEMLLVACRKDQITPYLEVIKNAGLIPKIVDVNSFAFERALKLLFQQDTTVQTKSLLNLNKVLSSFIVVTDDNLVHAHDQSYDGKRLLTQTQNYLAEHPELKTDYLNDQAFNTILTENLISHLRHTIHLFYTSKPNTQIDQLALSGECAVIPELSNFIEREIGIKTCVAEPFQHMHFAPTIAQEEIKKLAPSLMLCCGLALSNLN